MVFPGNMLLDLPLAMPHGSFGKRAVGFIVGDIMAPLGNVLLKLSLLTPHGLLGNTLSLHQDTTEHVDESASPLQRNTGRSKRTRSSLTTNSYNKQNAQQCKHAHSNYQ